MKYREILREMPIAMPGDSPYESEHVASLSKTGYDLYWSKIADVSIAAQDLEIIGHKNGKAFHVGRWAIHEGRECFDSRFLIDLDDADFFEDKLQAKYQNLRQVNFVFCHEVVRALGIAKFMYRWLVKERGITLLGDTYQYFGARKLWSRLSEMHDIAVDVVDVATGQTIEANKRIQHGNLDHEFDPAIWSYDTSREHIRLVLREIY